MATQDALVLAHTCVATPRAHRYLADLAERWADKVVVAFEADRARIDLPAGPCFISAGPGSLAILLEAPDERGWTTCNSPSAPGWSGSAAPKVCASTGAAADTFRPGPICPAILRC